MSVCGYMDILGTRHASEHGEEHIREFLISFSMLVINAARNIDMEIFIVSDGVFYMCKNMKDFREFYCNIRNSLFERGMYFRSSLLRGSISLEYRAISEMAENYKCRGFEVSAVGEERESAEKAAMNVVKAYQIEEAFGGIGCVIAKDLCEDLDGDIGLKISQLYYIDRSGNPRKYYDFLFDEEEINRRKNSKRRYILDRILKSHMNAQILSNYISSKYTSVICNVIRSSDLSRIKIDRYNNNGSIKRSIEEEDVPEIVKYMSRKSVLSKYKKTKGMKLLVLTLYDKFYSDAENRIDADRSCNENIYMATLVSKYIGNIFEMSSVPNFVISPNARRSLIETMAEIALGED